MVPKVVSFRCSRGWNSCSALAGIVGHSDALDSRLWPILLIEHKKSQVQLNQPYDHFSLTMDTENYIQYLLYEVIMIYHNVK